jgi:hypothetical protein
MSRILRRPLFRGGPASSEGVGITSGLNTPKRGFVDGPGGYAGEGKEREDITTEDIFKPYNLIGDSSRLLSNLSEQGYNYGIRPILNAPKLASNYIFGTNFEQTPEVDLNKEIIKNLSEEKIQSIREEKQKNKNLNITNLSPKSNEGTKFNEYTPTKEKNLPSLYDEFSSIINKANLVDQDEITKQKYLELSKFGLNLLRQPGGPVGGKPNLMGAIAAAAEKPLEGYSNILAKEAQAKQVPKQLALQATLSAMAPGQYSKAIRDLVQSGVPPEKAREFVLKEATAQQRAQDRLDLDYYGGKLSDRFDFLKNKENIKKGIPDSATQSFLNWKKINPNLTQGQISELPKDKDLAIDKKYYIDPNTGVIVRFDKKKNDYLEAGEI